MGMPVAPDLPHPILSHLLEVKQHLYRKFPDVFEREDHSLRIALRTYALSLSLSLGPAIIPLLTSRKASDRYARILRVLQRELSLRGFAFAMTVAVAGGAVLDRLWNRMDEEDKGAYRQSNWSRLSQLYARLQSLSRYLRLHPKLKTFLVQLLTSTVAIILLQSRPRSHYTRKASIPLTVPLNAPDKSGLGRMPVTLDLTIMFFVRAMDTLVQAAIHRRARGCPDEQEKRSRLLQLTNRVDALVFWASSARIMWCFFYELERLPRSYVRWIKTLANIDQRLLEALRDLRSGSWSYGRGARSLRSRSSLMSLAEDLGYPGSWGDPVMLPQRGGAVANRAWKWLGVEGRAGIGGVPCEIVHGSLSKYVGNSCTSNAVLRGAMAFGEALAIYIPVHFLPILLTRPKSITNLDVLRRTTISVLRSSLFLSTFVSSIWSTVCMTRTLVLARLLPNVSHNFWDGSFGCILAGCLTCGSSIWIERGRRRGEMALYVLPRAVRALLGDAWLRSGSFTVELIERLAFVLSLSLILTASKHYPDTLRGLSRWTLSFILKGSGGLSRRNTASMEDRPPKQNGIENANETIAP